jgi:site-specific DNA-methyltransferase (adenine-specific)
MKINISDIIVSKTDNKTKRFRKDFGNVIELSESLKSIGLIHPIVVDEVCTEEPSSHDPERWLIGVKKYRLIAGERRLRAAMYAGWTEIEVTLKDEMTDLAAKEMELEENVKRKDIDWEEQVEAVRQIHELKVKQQGQSTRTKDGWGIEKTAALIGASVGLVSQDIKLAKQLNENPNLRKKVRKLNKASARKLVDQELKAAGLRKVMKERCINIGYNFQNVACESGIKQVPANSIHCLITDPPFALDAISKVGGGTGDKGLHYNTTQTNVSTEEELDRIYKELIPELYRVLVEGAHFYIFLGMGWYTRLCSMLRRQGFVVDDQPIIWDKCRTSIPSRGAHYMSRYEAILFGHRPPQKRILLKPTPNVLTIPTINPASRVHPLQKPFDLLKILIENSTSLGEVILDCFCGSASTLLAANKLQRCSRGFELDPDNYIRACKWLHDNTKDDNETVNKEVEEYERIEKCQVLKETQEK